MRRILLVVAVMAAGCSPTSNEAGDTAPVTQTSTIQTTTPSEPLTVISTSHTVTVRDGASEPVDFDVPYDDATIAVTVDAPSGEMAAVAGLTFADGVDRIGATGISPPMLELLRGQHVRAMPGDLIAEAGVGTASIIYPQTPGMGAPRGEATVVAASTASTVTVTVTIAPPITDPTLHLDVFDLSSEGGLTEDSVALRRASEILGQAGIAVAYDRVDHRPMEVDVVVDRFPDTLSMLRSELDVTDSPTLSVFILDQLGGVSGLSPIAGPVGPHDMAGVLVATTTRPSDLGRVIAHEVAHHLGLHHLTWHTDSGAILDDPIPDTEAGMDGNLMASGTLLTEGQVEVLVRNPRLSGGQ